MAIDGASYLGEMDIHNPADSDNRSEGAGQIRAIKTVLKRTFPSLKDDFVVDTRPFIPVGFIAMYSGSESSLTPGWAICDGRTSNGYRTPDLRGRFIMGATSSERVGTARNSNTETNMGQYVGAAPHALTINEIPPHDHEYHSTKGSGYSWGWYGSGQNNTNFRTGKAGGGASHKHRGEHLKNFDKRPAYYTLAFIAFVGLPSS